MIPPEVRWAKKVRSELMGRADMGMGDNEDDNVEDVRENAMDVGNEEVVVVENNNHSKTNQPNPQSLRSGTRTSGLGLQATRDSADREVMTGISERPLVHKRSWRNGKGGGEKVSTDFLESFKLPVLQEMERREEERERREEERKEERSRREGERREERARREEKWRRLGFPREAERQQRVQECKENKELMKKMMIMMSGKHRD